MISSRSIFRSDSTFASDSNEENQTRGSPSAGRISPRAIAIVRCLMTSREAIPMCSVIPSSLMSLTFPS
jgi:hypothetical protein